MDVKISDLKIGTPISLGRYSVRSANNDPPPITWIKCTTGCDFITQSVVDALCFDAPEPRFDSAHRNQGGTDYGLSNILSFMNSTEESWYYPTHIRDLEPDYSSHYGFLYYFEDYEVESLTPRTVGSGYGDVTAMIHLPSVGEITGVSGNEERFKYFSRHGIRAKASVDLAEYKHEFSETSYVHYWLRDYREQSSAYTSFLKRGGGVGLTTPNRPCGLRPVCTLKPDILAEQDESGCWHIKPYAASRNNICTDEELFDFLGLTQPE